MLFRSDGGSGGGVFKLKAGFTGLNNTEVIMNSAGGGGEGGLLPPSGGAAGNPGADGVGSDIGGN